jgi:hypothetical protein
MAGIRIEGNTSGNVAEVAGTNQLKIIPEQDVFTNPGNVGAMYTYVELDAGSVTGVQIPIPPEIDQDYRTRVSQDIFLDEENFNYTSQNTGKHTYTTSTMTNAWSAGQVTSNSGSTTTLNAGTVLATYAFFPFDGAQTLSCDTELGFSNQPAANVFVEWGLGIPAGATSAPTDGVFFRLNSAGLQGVVSNNGTETSTNVFPLSNGTGTWVYANNKKYQWIAYQTGVAAFFWVNDGTGAVLLGSVQLPSGQQRMTMASSGQYFYKHRIVGGAAGAVIQGQLGAYSVRQGGSNNTSTMSVSGNRKYGSYQGLSGGTMGSLANYANSANPTAAVPTNTTAALGTGLGGQFWETFSLAVNTDGIICSYQVPAGTVSIPGRRLAIRGVGLTSYVQTVLAGGPQVRQFSLAFGHTAVSLATTEAATTKAPRRIALAPLTQAVTAAQAVSTMISQPGGSFADFGDAPIYVNPGEFVALVMKCVGTVGTSGTIAHVVTFAYGWE